MSKEKQIAEIARDFNKGMCSDRESVESCAECVGASEHCLLYKIATRLYNAGYRKQSEGEWIYDFTLDDDDFYVCSVCGRVEVVNGLCSERSPAIHYPYCNCGAKMKGGGE